MYAVCNLVISHNFIFEIDPHTSFGGGINIEKKWGIIRVKRNKKRKVIPYKEIMVVPYSYDNISEIISAYYNMTSERLVSESTYKLKRNMPR